MRIDVKDLTKRFEGTLVLDRVNLEIREKEFLGLLGPSGSGKTTLLRILAGLEFADSGHVEIDRRDVTRLAFDERRIGFVFQQYALFNHLTVFENVAFGLKVRKRSTRPSAEAIRKRVSELLDLVQLQGFEDRFPRQLSGGQRQRVALARTLAVEPQVLLLDEPFGALDAKVRVELRRSLRDIHDSTGLTTVFVTHDQEEALDLADRVAIMHRGVIEQIGSPVEIYEGPKTPFVFDFLGRTNAFDCAIRGGRALLGDKDVAVEAGIPDGPGIAFVRPYDIILSRPNGNGNATGNGGGDDVRLPGTAMVRFVSALGQHASVELLYERRLLQAEMSRDRLTELGLRTRDQCVVSLRNPRIYAKREAEEQTGISERAHRPLRQRPPAPLQA